MDDDSDKLNLSCADQSNDFDAGVRVRSSDLSDGMLQTWNGRLPKDVLEKFKTSIPSARLRLFGIDTRDGFEETSTLRRDCIMAQISGVSGSRVSFFDNRPELQLTETTVPKAQSVLPKMPPDRK